MATYLWNKGQGEAGGTIAQWSFVENAAGGEITHCNNAGDIPIGVAIEAATDGDGVTYAAISGSVKIKVKVGGAAIADGAAVGTSATGTLVTKSANSYSVGFCVGAAVANEIAEVRIAPHVVA